VIPSLAYGTLINVFGKGTNQIMKMNYVKGAGCLIAVALAFSMAGCKPKTETNESETTNAVSPGSMSANAETSAMTNPVTAGSSVARGEYDTSLATNLHNAEMDTNAVATNAAGVAVGDVKRGQYDTSLATNLHNAEMAVEGAVTNLTGMTNLVGDMASMVTNMINSATNATIPDTNMPAPPTPPTMP